MDVDEVGGGGASRSTDPAGGTSSATDVSLREYVASEIRALDRHLTSEIGALRRETQVANATSAHAVEVAAHEAAERLLAHNGLIEQMRQQAETQATLVAAQASNFATRESLDDFKETNDRRLARLERFQAMLAGGLVLASFIGIANLVKVWAG